MIQSEVGGCSSSHLRTHEMQTYQMDKKTDAEPRLLLAATMVVTLRSFLLPVAQHFQKKGWRVDAIANGIEKDEVCRSTFDQVWEAGWSRNPLSPGNFMMTGRIRDLTIEHGYDIVHVHTPIAAFVTRFALDDLRHEQNLQVLYTAHGFHFHPIGGALRNKLFEYVERKAANWTDFLVVINHYDLTTAKEKRLIDRDRLRFMPGIGIDRSHYSSSRVSESEVGDFYRELNISAGTPVLLMVAEFSERKRHADAIHAFAKVIHPQARLVLAGTGPRLEAMKELAARLGVTERIHFLGQRNDIPVLMKACRALILPSSQEGLPRSVLEAMSMGVPVIGSRIRGTAELLERGAGLLFEPRNIDQLAEAMRSVIENSAIAATIGKTGCRQCRAYDLAHILHIHEELYKEALDLRRLRN